MKIYKQKIAICISYRIYLGNLLNLLSELYDELRAQCFILDSTTHSNKRIQIRITILYTVHISVIAITYVTI